MKRVYEDEGMQEALIQACIEQALIQVCLDKEFNVIVDIFENTVNIIIDQVIK